MTNRKQCPLCFMDDDTIAELHDHMVRQVEYWECFDCRNRPILKRVQEQSASAVAEKLIENARMNKRLDELPRAKPRKRLWQRIFT